VPSFLILLLLAFALMWLLLVRPQRRRQSEQVSMQESVRIGDEVVTAGGLYGTVQRIDEDVIAMEIADGVVVRIARRAIAGVMPREEEEELEEGAEEEGEPAAEEEIEPSEAKPS
jgi:preprotein translocase subunit YajC